MRNKKTKVPITAEEKEAVEVKDFFDMILPGTVKFFTDHLTFHPTYDWLFMPSEIGGSSALPVGDYLYVTPNLNGYRIARLGGNWYNGGNAGGFSWYCDNGVGYRYRNVGGRLVYVPTANV